MSLFVIHMGALKFRAPIFMHVVQYRGISSLVAGVGVKIGVNSACSQSWCLADVWQSLMTAPGPENQPILKCYLTSSLAYRRQRDLGLLFTSVCALVVR
jgi:hypothetical protein